MSLQPTSWVRVDLIPLTGSPLLWQASVRPIADDATYQGGRKRGGITDFGAVVRSLSDRNGSPVVTTFSFTVFDRDGFWRGLQADPNYRLIGQDVTYFLASSRAHTTAAAPRVLFRGQLTAPTPQADRKYSFSAQSRVGTRKGPIDFDAPVLKRKYELSDFARLPRDFVDKAVPFLWGEESDIGLVNSEGVDVSTGVVIPTDCGEYFQGATSGDTPLTPEYLTPPSVSVAVTGSGVSQQVECGIVALMKHGGKTTLGTTVVKTNYPVTPSATFYATWTITNAHSAYESQIAAYYLYAKRTGVDSTFRALDVNSNGGTFDNPEKTYVHNGTAPGDGVFGASAEPPPPSVNTAVTRPLHSTTSTAGFYVWFNLLGHVGAVLSISGTNGAQTAAYAKIPATDIGDTFASGKPFLLGPDGLGVTRVINGHTYFGFWGKKGDNRVEHHLDNSMPLRVNLCGWHENNDPVTMPVIDDAALVYQDVFTQLAGNAGLGYQTGAQLTIPSFQSAPIIPVLQSTTFQAVQDITKLYLGNAIGYKAAAYFDSFEITWRSFIEGMNQNFRFDSGENHHGQQIISTMNDEASADDGLLLRERIEIRRIEDAGQIVDSEIFNVIQYQYDKHLITGEYRSGLKTVRDDVSVSTYGERKLALNMQYVRDPATADDAAQRWLLDSASGPAYVTVITRLRRGATIELGTAYRVKHSSLITSTPRPMYLRVSDVNVRKGEVKLRGRDRSVLLAEAWDDTIVEDADVSTTIGNIYEDAATGTLPTEVR